MSNFHHLHSGGLVLFFVLVGVALLALLPKSESATVTPVPEKGVNLALAVIAIVLLFVIFRWHW